MSGVPDSVILKLERADHHIGDLNAEINRFLQSGPYKTVGEIDADQRATYRVSGVEPISPVILTITGDAIQNLRAALDYLACALWSRTNTGDCEHIYFPIKSAKNYKATGLGDVQGLGQDAVNVLGAVEPYEGGKGDLLWRLHRLSIIDKHRLPIAIAGANLAFHLPSLYPELFTERERENPWIVGVGEMRIPLKENDIIFRDDPGRELKKDVQFPFFVALDEPGVVERQPLLPTLHSMADFVSNTVARFAQLFT